MPPKPITEQCQPLEYNEVLCSKCTGRVRMAFDTSDKTPPIDGIRSLQPLDGLHLVNYYGYGMWRDHDLTAPSFRNIVLCAKCTDKFLIDNQWLERYLDQ
jgi:hypothetical protein